MHLRCFPLAWQYSKNQIILVAKMFYRVLLLYYVQFYQAKAEFLSCNQITNNSVHLCEHLLKQNQSIILKHNIVLVKLSTKLG